MNNIEQIIARLKTRVALAELIGPDDVTVSVSVLSALIAQLEATQKERDGLREKVNQADTEWQKMADRILAVGKRDEKAENESGLLAVQLEIATERSGINFDRAEKAEAALSAANEKLSKPVVMPPRIENIELRQPLEVEDMWRHRFIAAIKAAGFTVEGD